VVVPNVRRGVWWGASFVGYALHIERGVCGVCAHIYVCMWVWCVLPRSLGVCPVEGGYRKVPSQGVWPRRMSGKVCGGVLRLRESALYLCIAAERQLMRMHLCGSIGGAEGCIWGVRISTMHCIALPPWQSNKLGSDARRAT